ncbi:MAG: hypothetical protein L0Y36_01225 [Planctomycetales bacterium]|nr:hypothetical protein [Planctomycetales bacterium]
MNTHSLILVTIAACLFLFSGCQSSYTIETSIPLAAADAQTKPVNPLDAQAAVEKIAAGAGLVPCAADEAEDDLLTLADNELLGAGPAAASARTWKHPDHPVFLSMTRQSGEILLLLNCAPKAKPRAVRLYKSLEKQLSALPAALIAKPLEQNS